MALIYASLLMCLFPIYSYPRDIKTVEGSSRYVVPRTLSLEEAESVALQRAITDALAAEFGTIVQSEVWTEIYNDSEYSDASAWENGLNFVKGEWIETIGKPEIKHSISSEGYVVEIKVKGKAAAIEAHEVDIKATVKQSNGNEVSVNQKFISGNNLIVDFKSPVDGYLAIFLADAQSNVMQLLPFAGESVPATEVEGGRSYSFFSDNSGVHEEKYNLYTDSKKERNVLYILFSTKKFTKPLTEICAGVSLISSENFRKWLSRQRASNSSLQTIVSPILIVRPT